MLNYWPIVELAYVSGKKPKCRYSSAFGTFPLTFCAHSLNPSMPTNTWRFAIWCALRVLLENYWFHSSNSWQQFQVTELPSSRVSFDSSWSSIDHTSSSWPIGLNKNPYVVHNIPLYFSFAACTFLNKWKEYQLATWQDEKMRSPLGMTRHIVARCCESWSCTQRSQKPGDGMRWSYHHWEAVHYVASEQIICSACSLEEELNRNLIDSYFFFNYMNSIKKIMQQITELKKKANPPPNISTYIYKHIDMNKMKLWYLWLIYINTFCEPQNRYSHIFMLWMLDHILIVRLFSLSREELPHDWDSI